MNNIETKSLAQIVTTDHRAAALFEKYHLDFCCKGKRTLEQACNEKNLQVDTIISQLEEIMNTPSNSATDFEQYSPVQLIEHIVQTHHEYVKKEIPQILSYLQRIAAKHGERHPEMVKVFALFTAISEELEQHLRKEELILFPRIRDIEKLSLEGKAHFAQVSYLQSPITVMEHEHDDAGTMMQEIRDLTNDYSLPADACTTYRLSFAALQAFEADLHAHVHLENNLLFPKAINMVQSARNN